MILLGLRMRWSIVRLIWLRELRDQLRDRRTLFMIVVLPIFLYPIGGLGLMQLAVAFLDQQNVVLVCGAENLPSPDVAVVDVASDPRPWLAAAPAGPGAPLASIERAAAAGALGLARPYPPLLVSDSNGRMHFPLRYLNNLVSDKLVIRTERLAVLPDSAAAVLGVLGESAVWGAWSQGTSEQLRDWFAAIRTPLDRREVDLILVVPPDFLRLLEDGKIAPIHALTRPGDERSRLVRTRIDLVLSQWKRSLKEVRLARQGLPAGFDETLDLRDVVQSKTGERRIAESLFDMMVKIFPFVLVMWSLAGALYPAVDLCAGEKERGTMETLLISPASRAEIVWGKFLTIWLFSAATALFNLLSMGVTTWQFSRSLTQNPFQLSSLFWAVVLLLPLSAFFSAVSLAVGAYARSSKEGQYYLMPLFLVTMPLVFLTLAPGVELNPFYCLVPVTGVALLLQKLMVAGSPDTVLWLYFVPVLAPMVIYSWLALRWAIEQFQSEEVLFREAERLDLGLWLKRLLREKESLPSSGEAIFCFALILGLRWLALGVGTHLPLLVRTGVSHLAFVATPALFMALLLTTRPLQGLGLRRPPAWSWPVAALLAACCVIPISLLTKLLLGQIEGLITAMEQGHPLIQELRQLQASPLGARLEYFLVLAVLPAICEELAFRGFILSGLSRRFRPLTAMFLSSFLFALYQMNVFQFAAHFVFGLVLALLVQRTRSVYPAMVFHLVFNSLVMLPLLAPDALGGLFSSGSASLPVDLLTILLGTACGAGAVGLIALLLVSTRTRSPAIEGTNVPGMMVTNGVVTGDGRASGDLKQQAPP
jgi:sodium transport system permease protein